MRLAGPGALVAAIVVTSATAGEPGAPFLLGADVSMLPRLEAAGAVYRENGKPADALRMMRERGANVFRVRLFVDPDGIDGAVQDRAYVLDLARRIEATGAAFLLDLHYSDTWADPGRQTTPAAWSGLDRVALADRVESWTRETISAFADAGCAPDVVQIGNEITHGFLWPEGRLEDDADLGRFTALLKAGIRGARAARGGHAPRILLHIDTGGDAARTTWFFRHLQAYDVDFDVIGLSFYPWWHGTAADLQDALRAAAAFGKDVVLVETAYPWRGEAGSRNMAWPVTPEGQRGFLEDVVRRVHQTPDGRGAGVLWWAAADIPAPGLSVWKDGTDALFDGEGRPLPALEAFRTLTADAAVEGEETR